MFIAAQPTDVPPDVALLAPEPADGALPVLKPLEAPGLELLPESPGLLVPPVLPGLLAAGEAAGLAGVLALGVLLAWPAAPLPEPSPAAAWADPGRTSATAALAAIPPAPARAVSDRTADRPRRRTAAARAISE
ncbi:MAG TPA: hypothetical protein VH478_22935 [Trebonia sp.]|nr:hypothetical protein [Trebonia sp.]